MEDAESKMLAWSSWPVPKKNRKSGVPSAPPAAVQPANSGFAFCKMVRAKICTQAHCHVTLHTPLRIVCESFFAYRSYRLPMYWYSPHIRL